MDKLFLPNYNKVERALRFISPEVALGEGSLELKI